MANPRARVRHGRRVLGFLVGIAVLAVLVRLWALGTRVAHWDEARVAYWVLQYAQTGEWSYHPVLHGPLLFHVERWLFTAFHPTDFVMRLPSALVGGALPLAAWLYRDHLSDLEVLAMGGLLAANPLLVYYSRFMRNDLLLAAALLWTLGCLLRYRATGSYRYALGAGLVLGAGVGTKENAVLYLLAWVGAAAVLVARRHEWDPGLLSHRAELAREVRPSARQVKHTLAGFGAFLFVVLLLYAPRGVGRGRLESVWTDPTAVPAVLEAGLVQPPVRAIEFWVLGSAQGDYPYYAFFVLLVGLLLVGAAGTVTLAAIGVARHRDRPIVAFAGFWAVLSLVGYPAAADLMAGWIAVHVVVPLTIPAAVGFASLVESPDPAGPEPLRTSLPVRRAVVGILVAYLVVTVGLTSFVAPGSTYNPIGQPSQMDRDAGVAISAMEAALDRETTDPTVAYVGDYWQPLVHRFPLAWYVERSGADRRMVASVDALDADPPPVLITHANRSATVHDRYPAYDCTAHERVPWEGGRPDGGPGAMLLCVDS